MECKLFPLDGGHQPISLPHGKPVVIGRGPLTRITDKRISREQVQLTADYESREVQLKQLGSNPGAMGHAVINKGIVLVIQPAETFSLLQKKYKYNVQFIDPVELNDTPPQQQLKDSRFSRHEIYRKTEGLHHLNLSPTPPSPPVIKSDDERNLTDSEQQEPEGKVKPGKPIGRVDSFKKRLRASFKGKKRRDNDSLDGASDDSRCSGSENELTPRMTRKISPMTAVMRVSQTELYLFGCDTAPCSACSSDVEESETEEKNNEFGQELLHEMNKVRDRTRTSTSNRSSLVLEIPLLTVKGEAQWIDRDGLMVYSGKDLSASSQIAAFDYDGTLVTTRSGETFPESGDDWEILFSNCKSKLNKLNNSGYKVVIFTNQKSLGKYNLSVDDFKRRIEQLEQLLGFSLQCFISTRKDVLRKPSPGMWDLLCREFNHTMEIAAEKSIFVGDAAGRQADFTVLRKEDHSCVDRCFARNIGVKFYTPEEFFDGTPTQTFEWPIFDPVSVYRDTSPVYPVGTTLHIDTQEIIMMVGWPGSGKTTFVNKHLLQAGKNYASCVTVDGCHSELQGGRSVVIDSTNPDVQSRQRFIDLAEEQGVSCRCFIMTTTEEHSRHNAAFRQVTSYDPEATRTSSRAFRQYNASFQAPTTDEGFEEIIPIHFVASFPDKERSKERLYFSFLL